MLLRIVFGLIVLGVDAFVINKLLSEQASPRHVELGWKMIEFTVQLLLLVLFGGILVQEYNRRRARHDAIHEFKRDILRDLSRAYSDAKGVRRILRAKCVSRNNSSSELKVFVPVEDYDEQIAKLNATQLNLEVIVRELGIIREGFGQTDTLIKNVRLMEKYLGKIVDEYEDAGGKRAENFVLLEELERLQAFIVKTSDEATDTDLSVTNVGFKSSIFFKSYQDSLTIIGRERVKLV